MVASEIPRRMQEIRSSIEINYENSLCDSATEDRNLAVIKTVVEKKCLVVSPCYMFHFNRSILFSIFGALFTYGLLTFQVNTDNLVSTNYTSTQLPTN